MRVSDSVRKAIDDWEQDELESAMLHACNAVDGTAKKTYPTVISSNERFTCLLRENYDILGPMVYPGVNLTETRFVVAVKKPKAPGGEPDFADLIYGIHRCSHGHGDELPDGFSLMKDTAEPNLVTRMGIKKGSIRISDRIIFGLVAIVVLSPTNHDQAAEVLNGYFLTLGKSTKLFINEWWGRKSDFPVTKAKITKPSVILDFKHLTE